MEIQLDPDEGRLLMQFSIVRRIAFVPFYYLKGDVKQYEPTYNYQLKRVLTRFGFRTIDVSDEMSPVKNFG